MNKLALIIGGLFVTSVALADSNPPATKEDALIEQKVNFISIGDTVTVLKTEKTADTVDSLENVTVIEYAESFEEAAKKRLIEERRAARQE